MSGLLRQEKPPIAYRIYNQTTLGTLSNSSIFVGSDATSASTRHIALSKYRECPRQLLSQYRRQPLPQFRAHFDGADQGSTKPLIALDREAKHEGRNLLYCSMFNIVAAHN
jgi:hypothetical protein